MAKNPTTTAQLGAAATEATVAAKATPVEQKQPETDTAATDVANYPHTGDKEPVGLPTDKPLKEGDADQIGTDINLNESPAGDPKPDEVQEKKDEEEPKQEVAQLRISCSATFASMKEDLDGYVAAMGRTQPQTSESAAAYQKRLFNAYMSAFTLEGPEFNEAMGVFLEAFKANVNGCFDETMLNRAMSHIALSQPKLRLFSHFNHLFSTAAAVGAKTAGREVDLNAIAKELPTEQGRQFLLAYFR